MPHNHFAFIPGKWGRFFNPCPAHINAHFKPPCIGTHPQQVLAATQLSEDAAWPPGPPSLTAAPDPDPAAPPEAGAQMGAQKGRQSLAIPSKGWELRLHKISLGLGWVG